MKWHVIWLLGLFVVGGCSFSDPVIDKEINRYRGTGIPQQGDGLPLHQVDHLED